MRRSIPQYGLHSIEKRAGGRGGSEKYPLTGKFYEWRKKTHGQAGVDLGTGIGR